LPPPRNLGFFSTKDFQDSPALGSTEGASFLNPDAIAHFALVFFVMRFKALCPNYDFAVLGVSRPAFHRDYDGLVHFVADD
jgi:hypothetical protein